MDNVRNCDSFIIVTTHGSYNFVALYEASPKSVRLQIEKMKYLVRYKKHLEYSYTRSNHSCVRKQRE
jgi:hypothetical protein